MESGKSALTVSIGELFAGESSILPINRAIIEPGSIAESSHRASITYNCAFIKNTIMMSAADEKLIKIHIFELLYVVCL